MWRKALHIITWSLAGVATCTLLIAAMQKKEEKRCQDVEVIIHEENNHVFIDKNDILKIIDEEGAVKEKETSGIDLKKIEQQIERNAWVKNAELFFDNKQVLHANIKEREPVARIFTLQGKSYYIDSSCNRLPLIDKVSARVPMFTSFPSDKKVLSHPDSMVLLDIKKIAEYINGDSFLAAQVAQIDITGQGTYEMIPVLGNQLIKLGDANNLDEKFGKLKTFYKQVWVKTGFEKYEIIDLQYTNQVVATIRGTAKVSVDTAKAMQQFGNTDQQMKSVLNDTAFSAPVVRSFAIKDSVADVVKQNDVKNKKTIEPTATSKKSGNVNKKRPKAILKKH